MTSQFCAKVTSYNTPFTVSLHVCGNLFYKTRPLYIQISINETMCFVALSFLRCAHDTAPQTDSCCSLLTAACKYARDKKIQEKQQKLNSLPPILRPKNKKSRELAAVAHFQQKIRPRRFVDTDKLNRKQWARTEVALNPFLYDKKTS